ncbi:hypothetical protein Q5741_09400 [Paenibacillus sp. JX-17]|uniref:Uncharacterized protein n=1 Tax=Paenibacillus lacisoli TaxID=3064525 RepID=A0ABT9CBJ6_9BACL|nr:hypothetical protein [Paenibacillus sp. JX-17]MDO7906635.1 hypothetical protein [Paenibacillus sp. JX-17]
MLPTNKILTIRRQNLRNLLVIDMLLGTGVYYVIKTVSASLIVAFVGSSLVGEGLKWGLRRPKFKVIPFRIQELSAGQGASSVKSIKFVLFTR